MPRGPRTTSSPPPILGGSNDAVYYVLRRLSDAEGALADVRRALVDVCGFPPNGSTTPFVIAPPQPIAGLPEQSVPGLQAKQLPVLFEKQSVALPNEEGSPSRSHISESSVSSSLNLPQDAGVEAEHSPSSVAVRQSSGNQGTSSQASQASHISIAPAKALVVQGGASCHSTAAWKRQARTETRVTELWKEDMEVNEVSTSLQLPQDQVRKIYGFFTNANKSGSGFLTSQELEDLLVSMCEGMIDPSQISFIMNKFDKDNDGCLGFHEFITAFVNTPLMKVFHLEKEVRETAGAAREHAKACSLEPEYWAEMMGCKAFSLKRYVKKEIEESASCLAIPWVVAMFALYYFSTVLHLNYERVHAIDQAIYFDLTENANFAYSGAIPFEMGRMGHKNMYDVNSIADFWSWLDLGLLPLIWPDGWDMDEWRSNSQVWCRYVGAPQNTSPTCTAEAAMPQPTRPSSFYVNPNVSTYLYYNTVVAGVRLKQERASASSCPNDKHDLMAGLQLGPCLSDWKYLFEPDFFSALTEDDSLQNKSGGETVYLESARGQSAIRDTVRNLENEVWFSPYTSKIEIVFTTYNRHLDLFSVTNILFFVNRGGHFFKQILPTSLSLTPYQSPLTYVVDGLLFLLIAKIIGEEAVEIYRSCAEHGRKLGLKLYLRPSNIVDWLNVCAFGAVSIMWILHIFKIRELRDTLRHADVRRPGSFANRGELQEFYDSVDTVVRSELRLKTILALVPYIIGMRFFKVFALQPRLGVVTATFKTSFVDLIHFSIVFLCIFIVFVVSSMILFGHQLDEFTNFGRAVNAVFRVMLGDYDWDSMVRIGRFESSLWFWSFTWTINFVMLNMLLAIVMDTYTAVKGNIPGDAESLWSQLYEIWVRWRAVRSGHQVAMDVVYENLLVAFPNGDASEDQRLTIEALMGILPDMPEIQAKRLLVETFRCYEEDTTGKGCTMSETMTRVKHIFKNTQSLHKSSEHSTTMIEALMELCKMHFQEMRYHAHKDKRANRHMVV